MTSYIPLFSAHHYTQQSFGLIHSFLKIDFILQRHFRLTAKLNGKYREFPHILCPTDTQPLLHQHPSPEWYNCYN